MNAMQKMTEGMIKENQPKFEVGVLRTKLYTKNIEEFC